MKKIAVIGSSGGNLYRQGGDDPKAMIREIKVQAESAGMELAFVQFIGANASMDNISADASAKLYALADGAAEAVLEGTLAEMNQAAGDYDEKLAKMIEEEQIDAVVILSCGMEGEIQSDHWLIRPKDAGRKCLETHQSSRNHDDFTARFYRNGALSGTWKNSGICGVGRGFQYAGWNYSRNFGGNCSKAGFRSR